MGTKKTTAIGLGMQNLFVITRNKVVEYRNDYYIDATSKVEAENIWNQYEIDRMQDPNAKNPKIKMIFSQNHAYDDYDDTNYTGVREEKFDSKNTQHQKAVKLLDPEEA
jgi:hypothetical protein